MDWLSVRVVGYPSYSEVQRKIEASRYLLSTSRVNPSN